MVHACFTHGVYTYGKIPKRFKFITPVINGRSRVNPLITGVITHLLSGMSHQVPHSYYPFDFRSVHESMDWFVRENLKETIVFFHH